METQEQLLGLRLRRMHLNDEFVDFENLTEEKRSFHIEIYIEHCHVTIPRVTEDIHFDSSNIPNVDGWDEVGDRERYHMEHKAAERTIVIESPSLFGAYHALTTIRNLIEGISMSTFKMIQSSTPRSQFVLVPYLYSGDDLVYGLPFGAFHIDDSPHHPVRAVMIDSARSFLPNNIIFEILDQMAMAKLNTLLWHVVDDQSFPLALGTKEVCASDPSDPTTTLCQVAPWDDVMIHLGSKDYNITDFIHGKSCHSTSDAIGNCVAAVGTGAIYTREDLAAILMHAWLAGISVIFEIDSPAHARSWGHAESVACDELKWGETYDQLDYQCPSEDVDDPLTITCRDLYFQRPNYCVEQICGMLNIALETDGETPVSARPFAIFEAITGALESPIDWQVASLRFEELYIDRLDEIGPHNFTSIFRVYGKDDLTATYPLGSAARFINSGEFFHIGLNTVHTDCYSPEDLHLYVTVWTERILNRITSQSWRPIAYHDGLSMAQDLGTDSLVKNAVAQVWDTTWDQNDKVRRLLRDVKYYLWSDQRSTYLDCGYGNTGVTGFNSWCDPYKDFWDLYNVAPDTFTSLNVSRHINPNLVALGGIAVMFSEQVTIGTLSERIFPRAAALAGALWTGRNDRPATLARLDFVNDVVDTFDFQSIDSEDFRDETEWHRWTFNLVHLCYNAIPGKSLWCSLHGEFGEYYCSHWTQYRYDDEWNDKYVLMLNYYGLSGYDELKAMQESALEAVAPSQSALLMVILMLLVAVI